MRPFRFIFTTNSLFSKFSRYPVYSSLSVFKKMYFPTAFSISSIVLSSLSAPADETSRKYSVSIGSFSSKNSLTKLLTNSQIYNGHK